MNRCFIGLGTNLGDRLAQLRAAAERLAQTPGWQLRASSKIWETRPVGPGSGPYLNAALELHGEPSAAELLTRLTTIEDQLGRIRRQRWGDRCIDLDLLCSFDPQGTELHISSPTLTLPHPGVHERDFVLRPLLDIDAELIIDGRRCDASLAKLGDAERTLLDSLDASWVTKR